MASADGGTPLFMAIQAGHLKPLMGADERIGERLLGIKLLCIGNSKKSLSQSEFVGFDIAFAVLASEINFLAIFQQLIPSQVGPYVQSEAGRSSLGAHVCGFCGFDRSQSCYW